MKDQSLQHGRLDFDFTTLTRNLKPEKRAAREAAIASGVHGAGLKKARQVVSPVVELALARWCRGITAESEIFTRKMLQQKRQRIEDALGTIDKERLGHSDGWISSFCSFYWFRPVTRHGEAASAPPDMVSAERERIKKILFEYPPKNRFNIDETALYGFAPPDRGLTAKQLSGKKSKSKFRITLALGCNYDGSEMLEPLLIGKSEVPRAIRKDGGWKKLDFYYRSNSSAWMTGGLWLECVLLQIAIHSELIVNVPKVDEVSRCGLPLPEPQGYHTC